MRSALYYARKEQGICTYCGKEPASTGRTYCSSCADMLNRKKHDKYVARRDELVAKKRADYAWYKDHGICPICRKADAAPGRVSCAACLYIGRQRIKSPRSEATKQLEKDRAKKRREDLKKAGLCVACAKRTISDGHSLCDYCRAKNRNQAAERRHAAGEMPRYLMGDGYHCYICGSTDLQPGKKLCRKHCAEKTALIQRAHKEWAERRKQEGNHDND